MNNNKKKMKFLRQEMANNSIELKYFLLNCCGIYNEDLFSSKISHKDIKALIPSLKRVSFDSLIKDISSLYNGTVVAVKDSYGNILPYVNPKVIGEDLKDIDISYFKCEKDINYETIDMDIIDKISVEELINLCKKLRKYKRLQEFRVVNKTLKTKKCKEEYCKVKQYKKEKYNLVLKGREEND